MDRDRAHRQLASPSHGQVIWLFPVRRHPWRGEVWARVEHTFGRCEERLFRSRTALSAAEEALAAAHEHLHRTRHA